MASTLLTKASVSKEVAMVKILRHTSAIAPRMSSFELMSGIATYKGKKVNNSLNPLYELLGTTIRSYNAFCVVMLITFEQVN